MREMEIENEKLRKENGFLLSRTEEDIAKM